jgi:putative endonuclease
VATDAPRSIGLVGEDATATLYRSRGFDIVARNWRCDLGELDLVARRDGLLVFCEVKTRSGDRFGGGFDGVTGVKRARLRRLAETFLLHERPAYERLRFDVASVLVCGKRADVELYQDAF